MHDLFGWALHQRGDGERRYLTILWSIQGFKGMIGTSNLERGVEIGRFVQLYTSS